MQKFVKDSGPLTARALVIGEAPGKTESIRGIPFVGDAGSKLTQWTKRVGIDRMHDLRITNTYPFQPPKNNLAAVPWAARERHLQTLMNLIERMPNLKLIIPMGKYAVEPFKLNTTGTITQIRGSVYPYNGAWVLPMIHPALSLYTERFVKAQMKDWERAAFILRNPTLVRIPQREHEIMPSLQRLREFLREVRALSMLDCLAIDIETPKKVTHKIVGYYKNGKAKRKKIIGERFIASIAFSYDPLHSLTAPLTRDYWGKDLAEAWDLVQAICETRVPKCFHWGVFDVWHLARVGIKVRHWWWDTFDMHHALDAWSEHSLAYCCSTDTWEPFFKDEGKGQSRGIPFDLHRFWRYNGKDACVTRELQATYKHRLRLMECGKPVVERQVWAA